MDFNCLTLGRQQPNNTEEKMKEFKGVTKRYLKDKKTCKVTFRLPAEAVQGAKEVHLVGDFNNWDTKATPMTFLKDGSVKAVVNLETGKDYKYRYLIDGHKWENDWKADRYEPSPMAWEDNSVVSV